MDLSYNYIIIFRKAENMIYLGHLDFQHLWERLIRISGIPIRFSEGLKKNMKFNLLQPLGLGIEGYQEYLHLSLTKPHAPRELLNSLTAVLPAGLTIKKVAQTRYPAKWFHHHKSTAFYEIHSSKAIPTEWLSQQADIISFQNLSPKKVRLKVINSPDKQVSITNLLSSLTSIDSIHIQRIRLEYSVR